MSGTASITYNGNSLFSMNINDNIIVFDDYCKSLFGKERLHFDEFLGLCRFDDRDAVSDAFSLLKDEGAPVRMIIHIGSGSQYTSCLCAANIAGDLIFGSLEINAVNDFQVSEYMDSILELNEKIQILEEEHDVFGHMIEACPFAMMVLDDYNVHSMNSAAAAILGLDEGDNIKDCFVNADDLKQIEEELSDNGLVNWCVISMRGKHGEPLDMQININKTNYCGKNVLMACCVERGEPDLTENKVQMIKAISEQNARAKSEFIAEMSRDIRTPMNAILGFTSLMRYTGLTPKQSDYNVKTEQAARELFRTINNVLDFSKGDVGKLKLITIDFKLEDIIMDVQMYFASKAIEKGILFKIDNQTKSTVELYGDPIRLNQILHNLIMNAVQYTNSGEVTLTVSEKVKTDSKITLLFEVADTGVGMSSAQQELLFTPLDVSNASAMRKYGGAGLSLVICKSLVKLMNGTIWCESKVDSGSTFRFTSEFELSKGDYGYDSFNDMPDTEETYDDRDPKHNEKVRILVVEDVEINKVIINEQLKIKGYKPDFADNGEQAIYMLEANKYDIVFMDLRMPIMDGLTATRIIRKQPKFANLPIIALTAQAGIEDRERSKRAGMNSYVTKPFEAELVYKAIRQWIK